MNNDDLLLRSKMRMSMTHYRGGSVEITSLVTQTSIVLPAEDYAMLARYLSTEETLQALPITRSDFIRQENAG